MTVLDQVVEINPYETALIKRARQGDEAAFSEVVEKYHKQVFNLCYRMLSDAEDAEDAAQETYLRAYRNLDRYDPDRKFSTWLLSIASHYCIDQIRKRRFSMLSIDDSSEVQFPDNKPGPESQMDSKERQKRVHELLESLSEVDRAAVIMRYWHELSYEDISEGLGLTVSAVKSRLHRSRLLLAENWSTQEREMKNTSRQVYGAEAY